jgi:hypothetical protein
MATMLVLIPLSGFAGRLLQGIQIERIKAADARIGTITESASLLPDLYSHSRSFLFHAPLRIFN